MKKKEITGSVDVRPISILDDREPIDDQHCKCGGYLWPIHDSDGLIEYYICGDCGAKK